MQIIFDLKGRMNSSYIEDSQYTTASGARTDLKHCYPPIFCLGDHMNMFNGPLGLIELYFRQLGSIRMITLFHFGNS